VFKKKNQETGQEPVTLALRVQSQVESETRKIYVLHEGFWILF
jgi:hypothetical protein